MSFIAKYSLVIGVLLLFLPVIGQDTLPDCIHPKTLSIPLNEEVQGDYLDKIYYQVEDNYTYWYKLEIETSCELSYNLNSINSEDDYSALIYKYDGTKFCNDLVYKKVTPFITKSKATFFVQKEEVYYVGVLHINGPGCGHTLFLDSENKSATIKAIQNECVEEAMEIIVQETPLIEEQIDLISEIELIEEVAIEIVEEVVESEVETDTVKEEVELPKEVVTPVIKLIKVSGRVINSNTKQSLEASVFILDGEREGNLYSTVESGFVFNYSGEGFIFATINKFGYEPFSDTIRIEDNQMEIALTPIKVGDKLVMHKVYFYPNTYALKEESRYELTKLTKFMLENSDYSFEIQGHTNGNRIIRKTKKYANKGEEWNFFGTSKKLSKLRAEKIKSYLVKNGVKESQLITVGYGGDKMIVEKPRVMKEAMKNIRVEVIVID